MTDNLLQRDLTGWLFRSCEQVESFNKDAEAASNHTQRGGGRGDETNTARQALLYLVEKCVLLTMLGRKEYHKMVLSNASKEKKLKFYTAESEGKWRSSIAKLSKHKIQIQDPKTITNNRRSKNVKLIDSGINCKEYCEFMENWLGYKEMFHALLVKQKNQNVKSQNKCNNNNENDRVDLDRLQCFKTIIDQFLRVKVNVGKDDDDELGDVPFLA